MICAPSVGEEQTAIFDKVYYVVRYILNEAKLKIGWFLYVPQKSVCLKSRLIFQIQLYWKEIEERITLICPQKRQSESFVLIYEWLKVII